MIIKNHMDKDIYGKSPALECLDDLKAYNALPEEERVKASADFIKRTRFSEDGELLCSLD